MHSEKLNIEAISWQRQHACLCQEKVGCKYKTMPNDTPDVYIGSIPRAIKMVRSYVRSRVFIKIKILEEVNKLKNYKLYLQEKI